MTPVVRRALARIVLPAAIAGLLVSHVAAPAMAADPLRIGFITATSGALKFVAEPSVAAFDLALEDINRKGGINGHVLEAVRFDTGSDPRQASVGARKLAQDDKVLAIVGPFSSGETAVTVNDAERLHILMMPPSATRPGITDGKTYTWRLTEDEQTQFARLLKSMKAKGIRMDTAEIVYVSDEAVSNGAGTKSYPDLFTQFGVKFGAPIAVQAKSFDVAAQIARVMEAKPDIVAVAALPDGMSKIVHELRRQGYAGRIVSSQIAADPAMPGMLGPDGNGVLLVASFWKGHSAASLAFNDAFVAENQKRGIRKAGAHHSDAQTYDTVHLVADLLRSTHATGDPAKLTQEREALAAALKAGVKFTGVLGDDICFSGNDAELPGYMIEIKDGLWTKFDEAPADPCK